ncbi:radical SAM/SPASM domain-containing protein [Candidatus Margulisiibacteriota bacterium]
MTIPQALYDKWSNNILARMRNPVLEIIAVEITRKCNLNCIFCGSPKETICERELTREELVSMFKKIKDFADLDKVKFVCFTGGEPLLRKDLLPILRDLQSLGYKNFAIQTNGLILADNKDLIGKLIQNGVGGIGTNIDGIPSTHNKLRACANAYEKAIKAIHNLLEYKGQISTTITTTVSKMNINELEEVKKLVLKLQPDIWRINPVISIGRTKHSNNLVLSTSEYKKLHEFILVNRVSTKEINIERACGEWLGMELEGFLRPYVWHCVSGINTMTILCDGNITGCSNIDRKYIQGNGLREDIKEIWQNRFEIFRNADLRKTGECADCSQWPYCHGGCFHNRDENFNLDFCGFKNLN